jgi:hypothetical protein
MVGETIREMHRKTHGRIKTELREAGEAPDAEPKSKLPSLTSLEGSTPRAWLTLRMVTGRQPNTCLLQTYPDSIRYTA